MMNRYLLILLLSGMGTGMLKAEKTVADVDREPFEQPLIRPEKTRLSPAAARVEAYLESLPPGEREKPSVPCLLQVKDVAANSWPGQKNKAGTDWIVAELFFQINGSIVSLERQLFQDARKPVVPVGSRLLFPVCCPVACSGTPRFRGETCENPEKADEICRAVFKGLKKFGGTPPSIPALAPALRGKYVKKNHASAAVPESLQNGMKAVLFPSGAEERCLVGNRRWMELVPLPEEDYFLVVNHVDGHTSALLLYRVVRHENRVPVTEEGVAEVFVPEISVECVSGRPPLITWCGGWGAGIKKGT